MNPFRVIQRKVAQTQMDKKEPVALAAAIRSMVALLAVFGFELTAEQVVALIVVVEMILGLIVRARVTPVAKAVS